MFEITQIIQGCGIRDAVNGIIHKSWVKLLNYEVTLHALHAKIKDIEDALQYYAAIHHGIDYFKLLPG